MTDELPPDEDDLGFADTGQASVGEPIELKRPDRPKRAKTGGKIRGKIPGQKHNDVEAHIVLGSMMPDVIRFHYEVMQGKTEATFSGPTGKPVVRLPNLPERQKSADWLAENFWKLDAKLQATASTKAKPGDEVEDLDGVRDALAHLIASAAPPSPPPPVIDASQGNETLASHLDEGSVISITDPEQIKRFDAEIAAGKKPKPNANIKNFTNGFSWCRRYDEAIRKDVFDLYNPDGVLCGTRRSRERADSWCENEGAVT